MNILETITERTKERIREEKKQISINEIRKKAEEKASSDTTKFAFEQALCAEGLSFICEAKKASPSKGLIAPDFPYVQIAQDYEAGGVQMMSRETGGYPSSRSSISKHMTMPCSEFTRV